MELRFDSQKYATLTIIASSVNVPESLRLLNETLDTVDELTLHSYGPWHYTIPILPHCQYRVVYANVNIQFAYLSLSDADDMLSNGVEYLVPDPAGTRIYNRTNMHNSYGQPFRNQFHFSTFCNWMNDPNGLCYFKGNYHLFYQMHPGSMVWGPMHWGHAVSKDLLHWVHLPIALFPQEELCDRPDMKGGAFSGSAMVEDDVMTLFFTRCLSPIKPDATSIEYQAIAICRDGVTVTEEMPLIPARLTNGMDHCFRDPKVLTLDGALSMLLAGTANGIPCVFLYRRVRDKRWLYHGVFFKSQVQANTFECPNFIADHKDVRQGALLCALQGTVDECGRTSLTYCYMGCINDDDVFEVKNSRIYDFGTSAYAMQTMELSDRVLCFGWVHSPYDEFSAEGSASNGAITLPREVFVRDGWLYTVPAREVSLLEGATLYSGQREHIVIPMLDTGYRLQIQFSHSTDFCISLAQSAEGWIGLIYEGGRLTIHDDGLPNNVKLYQEIEGICSLDVFVDRSMIEVFVNDGQYVATKDYFLHESIHAMSATFLEPRYVVQACVTEMHSIW